eukprot:TRINITY_DN9636_c0_g1_i1.p1 TRINITY_DN9636_c0_g1~~TRINITY_DN9636_c0_g1_i1.p1  ORF type:complete len:119 (+),score=21.78 TRINITY_DN9636_c0_g1_i1:53-409(+)
MAAEAETGAEAELNESLIPLNSARSRLIDEEKKAEAMAACVEEHEELFKCLRKGGLFTNCQDPSAKFWSCYAEKRGVRGNKLTAWLQPRGGENQPQLSHVSRPEHKLQQTNASSPLQS